MNPKLLDILVEKQIVKPGTEINVKCLAPGLDGYHREQIQSIFTITSIKLQDDKKTVKYLCCARIPDGASLTTKPDNILTIDGMLPSDLAKAFDLQSDGSVKKVKLDQFGNPIKRGRKPKNWHQGNNNEQSNKHNRLSGGEAQEGIGGERTGDRPVEKIRRGRKLKSGKIRKHQRDAEAIVG